MTALVSIIVPVFNIENYIINCLKSLVNQTYNNIEIICIDDGSSDSSGDKIKSMMAEDERIKYYFQKNSGVSSARNNGIEKADGKYIIFVDGDDYLHYQSVEIFVTCMENSRFDMIYTHEIITHSLDEKMKYIGNYSCVPSDEIRLFENFNNTVCGKSVCFKIYRTSVVKKQKFPVEFSNGEDAYYNLLLIDKGLSIGEIDCRLYYYFQRPDSLVNSEFSQKQFSITLCFDSICDELKNSANSFIRAYSLRYLFQTIFYNRTNSIGTEYEKTVKTETKRIGNKWISALIKNKDIDFKIRIIFVAFYYSRHFYELIRMLKDPTMKDFYRNRKRG